MKEIRKNLGYGNVGYFAEIGGRQTFITVGGVFIYPLTGEEEETLTNLREREEAGVELTFGQKAKLLSLELQQGLAALASEMKEMGIITRDLPKLQVQLRVPSSAAQQGFSPKLGDILGLTTLQGNSAETEKTKRKAK